MSAITNVDVLLSNNANLKVENSFRYWLYGFGMGANHPMGLVINKSNLEGVINDDTEMGDSMDVFNNYSYILSYSCQIACGRVIDKNFKIKDTNELNSLVMHTNSEIIWRNSTGSYKYFYQIIWDKGRYILNQANGSNISEAGDTVRFIKDASLGALLLFQSSSNFLLRLIRKRTEPTNIYQYVDIPICGTIKLVDDGLTVNGFQWKQSLHNPALPSHNSGIKTMHMIDNNVVCRSTSDSTIWLFAGDILLSYDDPSWTMKLAYPNSVSGPIQEY